MKTPPQKRENAHKAVALLKAPTKKQGAKNKSRVVLPPKRVFIMKGLPGAGKSTRAQQLAAEAEALGATAAMHSTDSYFTDPETGVYRFDVRMMRVNHDRNFKAFCDSLAAGTHTVIVDNTNIQYWHYQRYEEEAVDQGYEVEEVVVGQFTRTAAERYAARSVHDVPLDKVMDMLEQWWDENGGETEDFTEEEDFTDKDDCSD